MNKDGFDRFGNNELIAPHKKWSTLKNEMEDIKNHAMSYEDVYNDIKDSMKEEENLKKVLEALPLSAMKQVNGQKERLVEARTVAIKEKKLYIDVSSAIGRIGLCPNDVLRIYTHINILTLYF